jgi:hypothetical protein
MKAVVYKAPHRVAVENVPDPKIFVAVAARAGATLRCRMPGPEVKNLR